MRKFLLWLLIFLLWPKFSVLGAQDEYPVIVSPPRSSVTVFTNYELIELTYTIGYLDGYRPLFEEAGPEKMSFGFEIDSIQGSQLVRRQKRKYKNENYEDLVYYLRHIGEKKGEILIPEQIFRYVKETPGQTLVNKEVYEVKAPALTLRYDSVLTKNADDIIDLVDFGNFKEAEYGWKAAMVVLDVLGGAAIFLLFYRPVKNRISVSPLKNKKGSRKLSGTTESAERLTPKEALASFLGKTQIIFTAYASYQSKTMIGRQARIQLANALRQLLTAYAPDILCSDTPREIHTKIIKMEGAAGTGAKNLLVSLASELVALDSAFYGQTAPRSVSEDARVLLRLGNDLKISGSFWRRTAAKLKNIFRKNR